MTGGKTRLHASRTACWIALALLVVPMLGSYFFDDMFSSVSHLFNDPSLTQLGWDAASYGFYTSGYSVLCIFGGLVVCGILLDRFGVRLTGTAFVGMMLAGAALVLWSITSPSLSSRTSLRIAYAGCMIFGLGSEIAGTAVTRSIAKWFKGKHMALAMSLQLAIARLGTAFALVLSPKLIQEKAAGEVYALAETARPAAVGTGLLAAGLIMWAIFVAIDARFDRETGLGSEASEEDRFRLSDALKMLTNKNFIMISLLCVLFYSSIVAFKKFAGAILIPRFGIPQETAGWMVSMLLFATVVFSPMFGLIVDEKGKGTKWMVAGAMLALCAHLILAFAPSGVPLYGYISMVLLGFGYSLVPAALWPSLSKIVPEKVLGSAYAMAYWVQNLGLLSFKMLSGIILDNASDGSVQGSLDGAFHVEMMYVLLCVAAVAVAWTFSRMSDRNPSLKLDTPNKT